MHAESIQKEERSRMGFSCERESHALIHYHDRPASHRIADQRPDQGEPSSHAIAGGGKSMWHQRSLWLITIELCLDDK